jgi:hypothetical protein
VKVSRNTIAVEKRFCPACLMGDTLHRAEALDKIVGLDQVNLIGRQSDLCPSQNDGSMKPW